MAALETKILQQAGSGVRTAFGIGGLIAFLLGLFILFYPAQSSDVAMKIAGAVIAAYAIVVGAVYLGSAIFGGLLGGLGRFGHAILGILYIIGGGIMFANLNETAVVLAGFLTVTIGILWIVEGVTAFAAIGVSASRFWTILYGVISIVAGVSLIFSPFMSFVTLWLLLGISMVVTGIVQMVRAFQIGSAG